MITERSGAVMDGIIKLTAGQRLWYKNKDTDLVGYVQVKRVYDDFFIYELNDSEHRGSYSWIGTRLFLSLFDIPLSEKVAEKKRRNIRKYEPLPKFKYKGGYHFRVDGAERPLPARSPKVPEKPTTQSAEAMPEQPVIRAASCDICALRKNGTGGSLSNQLCEDYRPTQFISQAELDSFPKFGLATEIRTRRKK